jgi:hypothetical protein
MFTIGIPHLGVDRASLKPNFCAKARICAIQKSIALSRADIDAVLDLQTSDGHNNAGVRDVRSIGGNLVPDDWTTVCGDRQAELPNAYGPASGRRCALYAIRNRLPLSHSMSPQPDTNCEMAA